VLLPAGFAPRAITVNGADLAFEREDVDASVYVVFKPEQAMRGAVRIAAQ
jgi:hypothetical protein